MKIKIILLLAFITSLLHGQAGDVLTMLEYIPDGAIDSMTFRDREIVDCQRWPCMKNETTFSFSNFAKRILSVRLYLGAVEKSQQEMQAERQHLREVRKKGELADKLPSNMRLNLSKTKMVFSSLTIFDVPDLSELKNKAANEGYVLETGKKILKLPLFKLNRKDGPKLHLLFSDNILLVSEDVETLEQALRSHFGLTQNYIGSKDFIQLNARGMFDFPVFRYFTTKNQVHKLIDDTVNDDQISDEAVKMRKDSHMLFMTDHIVSMQFGEVTTIKQQILLCEGAEEFSPNTLRQYGDLDALKKSLAKGYEGYPVTNINIEIKDDEIIQSFDLVENAAR
jgi:hypothetical protein